ncbi:P-loop containing nucleoside triphosphate hydrolase [Phytophthora cinnamomi]|uniref:P-loop containing nucleoside triphosphate hydrolase n=1 Tax=Phytophthora cinnamomi TaxID=4785 RepID=UPI003559D496|nr:P-loop containing nucleoside triphosphate hydrolase [Phytophthora cinnamomi]
MSTAVRCEVIGRQGDRELDDVLAFLRGFSALYGAGLALHSETHVSAAEVGELAAQALEAPGVERVDDEEPDALPNQTAPTLFARVTTPQKQLVVVGATALMRWMRQQLLETRYSAEKEKPTPAEAERAPLRLFVSGDRAQVGKSTTCLGLVGALLRAGYAAEDVAYIKPATQCEKPQLVTKFCRQRGVACCEVGPILFYKGFTREFLKGETDAAPQLLEKARQKVDELGRGKKVVVVDGVGYPAVGSICGVSNAHVAKTLGTPVVLVGKKGVGDAVDSFNLNAAFFESHGVKVLGGIFNRLPEDGFYSLEHCREHVTAYFEQFQPDKHVYGFIPELTDGGHSALIAEKTGEEGQSESAPGVFLTPAEDELAKKVVDAFVQHIDLTKLLADAEAHQGAGGAAKKASSSAAQPRAAKPKPKAKKPKRARNFEIPTSFETVSLPAFDTVAAPTSLNSVEIPTSTETMALPSFNSVEIPTSTETMALPPFDTVEIPTSTETMALPPFDTVSIPSSTETMALPPFDTVSMETVALPPFDTVEIPKSTDSVPI